MYYVLHLPGGYHLDPPHPKFTPACAESRLSASSDEALGVTGLLGAHVVMVVTCG